jgi:hypothetical protein
MAVRFNQDADGTLTVPVKFSVRLGKRDLIAALALQYRTCGRVVEPQTKTELVAMARGMVSEYGTQYTATALKGLPSSVVRQFRTIVRGLLCEMVGA